ncbi:hypothetical protein AgCh_024754 [Apium graveolens]
MNKKSEMSRKKHGQKDVASSSSMDLTSPNMDIRSIMKDIESFVSKKHMTWKERKELENKKVVSLGGKKHVTMPMLFIALACEEAEITSKRSTSANEEAERKRAENAIRGSQKSKSKEVLDMKFMKLGSRPDTFRTTEGVRSVSSEIVTDLIVQVEGSRYMLHKFPLLSKCLRLQQQCFESPESLSQVVLLPELPGGTEAFELCAKFCYGITITISAYNIISCMGRRPWYH